jgi:DNA-binding transcriptional ArsR family regulator
MRGEPNLAAVAALIADPARVAILGALADGRALPAGELAAIAGLSAQGASAHLAKLAGSGWLAVEREGRHRYYRLANTRVASALEALAVLAEPLRSPRLAPSPAAIALRQARSCYDHLAGALGVAIAESLEKRGYLLAAEDKKLHVTAGGAAWFDAVLGIAVSAHRPGRHGVARRCLDWTERRHHVAGPLGSEILKRMLELKWLVRLPDTRAVRITPAGHRALLAELGIGGGRES